MKEKVILAYSGGLDTTAIIPWLKETYGYEVICCCVDCGQEEELNGLDERADLVSDEELNEDFIMPEPFDPRVSDVVSQAVKSHIEAQDI